jgi:hypothetical protein
VKLFRRHSLAFLALLSLSLCARVSAQTTITVANSDFETNGLGDGGFSSGVIPTGWSAVTTITGSFFGYFNPTASAYSGTTGNPGTTGTMSGPNVFYFGSAVTGEGIQQTLAANFTAATNYTLTVAVGTRAGNLANTAFLDLQLLAGSTVIASTSARNLTADSFADFSLTFDALAAGSTFNSVLGQALTIRFLENDTSLPGTVFEADIDNVRLTSVTAVPEPATYALLALGAISLVALRRRKG